MRTPTAAARPRKTELKVTRDDDLVDVCLGKGVTLQFTIRKGELLFHGLGVGDKNNIGVDFDGAIDGRALPDCAFTRWILAGDPT